jgi:hypothetical protein
MQLRFGLRLPEGRGRGRGEIAGPIRFGGVGEGRGWNRLLIYQNDSYVPGGMK